MASSPPMTSGKQIPTPRLRPRPSFRERFWSRTSANYDGEQAADKREEEGTTTTTATTTTATGIPGKRGFYVPVNAASGFARTVRSPVLLPTMREAPKEKEKEEHHPSFSHDEEINEQDEDEDEDDEEEEAEQFDGYRPHTPKMTPLSRLFIRPGHLFVPTDCDAEGDRLEDDYETFLSSARTAEYARRILDARIWPRSPAGTYTGSASPDYQSVGSSYSPSARLWAGGNDKESHSPTSPHPDTDKNLLLAAPKSLRRQKSILVIGQRIAEYVRPLRSEVSQRT